MKALISSHQRKYPFTHSLSDLLELVSGLGEALPKVPFPLVDLDPYAVEFRYNFGTPLSD
jgi:HEPN domain-containing protein